MTGWICSYRKIWSHPMFMGNAERVGVWNWMLHTAAWKDTRFRVGRKLILLKRGQLCVSQRQICTATGMSHRKLRTFLGELQSEGAITQDKTQGRSLITICKYNDYQDRKKPPDTDIGTQTTHKRHTKEQKNNPSNEGAAAAPPSGAIEVSVVTKAVWNCKAFLESRGVANPGSMIGRWLKNSDPYQILRAIEAAQRAGTENPIPYIERVLQGSAERDDPDMRFFKSVMEGK